MVGRSGMRLQVFEKSMQLDDRAPPGTLRSGVFMTYLSFITLSSRVTRLMSWWDLEANSRLQTVKHTTMVAVRW